MRSKSHILILPYLLLFTFLKLYVTSVAAEPCFCARDGDVNEDGELTPTDALLAFRYFLRLPDTSLDTCQQRRADVHESAISGITPADTLCVFRTFLDLLSCLDSQGPPTRLEMVRGDGVRVVVNTPQCLVARVNDASGDSVAAHPVMFRLVTGNGTLSASVVSTDAAGEAAVEVTPGVSTDPIRVEASVSGLVPVVFTIPEVLGERTRLIEVGGNNQEASRGEELLEPLVVRVENTFSAPVAGVEVAAENIQGDGDLMSTVPAIIQSRGLPLLRLQNMGSASSPEAVTVTDAQGIARFRLQIGDSQEDVVTRVRFLDQVVDFRTTVITCQQGFGDIALDFGDIVTCNIAPAGDADLFRFFGTVEDTIVLTLTRVSGGPFLQAALFDPNQTQIASLGPTNPSSILTVDLEQTGRYTLRVFERGNSNTATYRVTLQCLFGSCEEPSQTCGQAFGDIILNFADNITCNIAPAGDADLFRFIGTAGDTVNLTVTRVSGGPFLQAALFDPNQTQIASLGPTNPSSVLTVDLEQTGRYTLRVFERGNSNTATYRVTLQCLFGPCESLFQP